MSISASPERLAAEYVSRTARLALLPRARPLPAELLAYESSHALAIDPRNLALELTRSILYETADSLDAAALCDLDRSPDSLWNGKPQQYFESLTGGDGPPGCDADSLGQ